MSLENWFTTACEPSVVRRAIRVSLIVGTILILINHGDALIRAEMSLRRLVKIILTYVVPYCVSTYASVGAIHELQNGEPGEGT